MNKLPHCARSSTHSFASCFRIRERKGYGERNKRGDILSDDHFPSFLERNFVERYDMVEVIYEVINPIDLYFLSEFLEGIRSNLAGIADKFIQDQSSSEAIDVPYAQQIIALRRLNWLKPFFLNKIQSFQKKLEDPKDTLRASAENPMLQQCIENAKKLDWASWPLIMDLLDKNPNLVDKRGLNVRSKFHDEVTEDICYGICSTLFCPCNDSIWCDLASKLTHELCYGIARHAWDHDKINSSTNLCEALIQKALEASNAIRSQEIEKLKFDTKAWMRYALNNRGGISKEPRGTKCVMTLADDCKWPEKRLPKPVILRGNSAVEQMGISKIVHKPWYLVRQIIFLVDTFAKKYLADDKSYSLEILCQKLGVSSEFTSLFLKRDIELDFESSIFFGKEFLSIYSVGNRINPISIRERAIAKRIAAGKKQRKASATAGVTRTPVRKLLFWDVLVKGLQKLGWNIDRGNRSNDWYVLPPGVARGKGFKNRVDFFDSAPLVIKCLKSDPRYCNQPAIKTIMEQYGKCQIEFEMMKSQRSKELKKLPNKEIVDLLVKKTNMAPPTTKIANGDVQKYILSTVKVVFHTQQLGLLLCVIDGAVVVNSVKNQAYKVQIKSGDKIVSVGDHCTRNKSLAEVCGVVRSLGRPLTIIFERKVLSPNAFNRA